jgi:hypothetical protein
MGFSLIFIRVLRKGESSKKANMETDRNLKIKRNTETARDNLDNGFLKYSSKA